MSQFNLRTEFEFHAVGQGLFSTGRLWRDYRSDEPFIWVYDCGTLSHQALVKQALIQFRAQDWCHDSPRAKLDLVTVSHFDQDHVSGLVSLLSMFSVRTLILPYIPMWQRLYIAFSQNVQPGQKLMRFFINPVEYIAGIRGGDVQQIVLVPGGSTPPSNEEAVEGQQSPNEDWSLDIDPLLPLDELNDDQSADRIPFENRGISIDFLKVGGTLRLGNVWEFVPYNDADMMPQQFLRFRKIVAEKRAALLATPDQSTLAELKECYDKYCGRSGVARNAISLFLYGGLTAQACPPNLSRSCITTKRVTQQENSIGGERTFIDRYHRNDGKAQEAKLSILYTGDGYLNTTQRIRRLIEHFGAKRMSRVACLQVMHHGSSTNWMPGLAQKISPEISVFSSDPDRKPFHHPHADVCRDFMLFGPTQVDRRHVATIEGFIDYW